MNSLVIYDSKFGNTEHVAQEMAKVLSDYGPSKALHVSKVQDEDLQDITLLILGCPIQGWRPSAGMQAFIGKLTPEALEGVHVTCFDTRMHIARLLTGSAIKPMTKELKGKGVTLVASAQYFYVEGREGPLEEGEVSRAKEWARKLAEQATTQSSSVE
jgi:flavodoxin